MIYHNDIFPQTSHRKHSAVLEKHKFMTEKDIRYGRIARISCTGKVIN